MTGSTSKRLSEMAGVLKIEVLDATNLDHGTGIRAGRLLIFAGAIAFVVLTGLVTFTDLKLRTEIFYTALAVLVGVICEVLRRFEASGKDTKFWLIYQHAFAVINFSWNVYKTKSTPMSRNKFKWHDKLIIPVLLSEKDMPIKFSFYGKHALKSNRLIAQCAVPASRFLSVLDEQDGTEQSKPLSELFNESKEELAPAIAEEKDVVVRDSSASRQGSTDSSLPSTPLPAVPSISSPRGVLRKMKEYWLTLSLSDVSIAPNITEVEDEEECPKLHIRVEVVHRDYMERALWEIQIKEHDPSELGKFKKADLCAFFTALGGKTIEEVEKDVEAAFPEGVEELSYDDVYRVLCKAKYELPNDSPSELGYWTQFFGSSRAEESSFIMNSLASEASAVRGWPSNFVQRLATGTAHKLGENAGLVMVRDRMSGHLIEEKMPTYVMLSIRMMYTNRYGGGALQWKYLQNYLRRMTEKQGPKFNDPRSTQHIVPFMKFFNLTMDEIAADSLADFKTFNEFFYRKLKPNARPIALPDNGRVAISPADCRCHVFESVEQSADLWVKGKKFTVTNLLKSEELGKQFAGGAIAIFRLAPQDYHRYHIPVNGTITSMYDIDGELYTVNPMAVRNNVDVYTDNKRHVAMINSKEFGNVAYVTIGATMVGSIVITDSSVGKEVRKGDEHGYFAFGGSTVILVFEKGRIAFDNDLVTTSAQLVETLIRMGNSLGTATQ